MAHLIDDWRLMIEKARKSNDLQFNPINNDQSSIMNHQSIVWRKAYVKGVAG
jgi:hypothetical protein